LDCEAVAYDTAEDKILPFQILSTRAKKSVELSQVRVKYVTFFFTCEFNFLTSLRETKLSGADYFCGKGFLPQTNFFFRVCLFVFDLVYLNGESLIKESLVTRRAKLHECFQEVKGFFHFAKAKDLTEPEEINAWLEESVAGNCEGMKGQRREVKGGERGGERDGDGDGDGM
jgi:DNA ligase-1